MKFEKNAHKIGYLGDNPISYSYINDSNFSNEYLYNYFISDTKYPITDIIIENGKNKKNKNYTCLYHYS